MIDKFNSYIKLETKKKDIEKKDIEKKDTAKEHIEKVNANKNSVENDAKNKPGSSADIKAHIIDEKKLIKKRYKSLLEIKKTIKNDIELIYSVLKPKESQPKLTELNFAIRKILVLSKKMFLNLLDPNQTVFLTAAILRGLD